MVAVKLRPSLFGNHAGRSVGGCIGSAAVATETTARRLAQECDDFFRGLRLHAGLLQKAQVAEPIHVAILPGAEGNAVAMRQATAHAVAIGQWITGMTAVAVNVHLHVRNAGVEHGGEILVGPDGVPAISSPSASDECRRRVSRNGRSRSARKWRGTGINNAHEIR